MLNKENNKNIEFIETAWEDMRESLDKELPINRSKKLVFIWLFLIAAGALIASMYIIIDNKYQLKEEIEEKVSTPMASIDKTNESTVQSNNVNTKTNNQVVSNSDNSHNPIHTKTIRQNYSSQEKTIAEVNNNEEELFYIYEDDLLITVNDYKDVIVPNEGQDSYTLYALSYLVNEQEVIEIYSQNNTEIEYPNVQLISSAKTKVKSDLELLLTGNASSPIFEGPVGFSVGLQAKKDISKNLAVIAGIEAKYLPVRFPSISVSTFGGEQIAKLLGIQANMKISTEIAPKWNIVGGFGYNVMRLLNETDLIEDQEILDLDPNSTFTNRLNDTASIVSKNSFSLEGEIVYGLSEKVKLSLGIEKFLNSPIESSTATATTNGQIGIQFTL